jgi:SAM-dependent methyltransferase
VVVASRSLHHVPDLPRGLDKIARLLRPQGRLILNEHAFDRFDEPTARWYFEKRAQIRGDISPSLERCPLEWRDDHAGLHGYTTLREELVRRFTEHFFTWTTYGRVLRARAAVRGQRARRDRGPPWPWSAGSCFDARD